MIRTTLFRDGNWYKGNTHLHTTRSDGEKTPAEAVELYRAAGYDFLAITDHERWAAVSGLGDDRFLVLPGAEVGTVWEGATHHIVGLARPGAKLPENFAVPRERRANVHPQAVVDYLHEVGALAIYAHPFWSYCDFQLLASLKGLTAMEICNFSCEQEWKTGIAETYFEYMWRDGAPLWCVGSDDAHGHVPDFRGGYITVRAKALTQAAILEAIEAGSFTASYAPMFSDVAPAPRLLDFFVEDGVVKIECTGCRVAYVIAKAASRRQPFYRPKHGTPDAPVTRHEYELPPDTIFVRAVLSGFDGSLTWSQPIRMDP